MPTVNGFNTTQGILKYNAEKLENYNTPEFSSSTTYSFGDYTIHDGKLYKYTSNTPSSGNWNISNWTFIVLTDEIKTLFNDVNNIENNIPEASDTNPLMDGIVSAGVSDDFSRADHIHPKDTSKQDKLTFDNAPVQNSTNPVTSGGVYTALSEKQDTLTFDNTPIEDSDNPVKSSGIYESILNLYPIDTASGSIASFPDGADDVPVKDLVCAINPVQDLHGYDNPWPAGGGKNIINPADYPSQTATSNQVLFTAQSDGSIAVSGTSSGTAAFHLYAVNLFPVKAGTYSMRLTFDGTTTGGINFVLSGGSLGSGVPYTAASVNSSVKTDAKSFTATADGNLAYVQIQVASGVTVSGKIMVQIQTGSTADAWTPYSNLCPISGHTDADVTRTGKNLLDESQLTNGTYNGSGTYVPASNYVCTPKIRVKDGESITYSFALSLHACYSTFFKADGTFLSQISNGSGTSKTVSIPSGAAYVAISGNATGLTLDACKPAQVEVGSTASDYQPYVGTTYPIPLGQTVYGGTLDVLTGVLTVTHSYIQLSVKTLGTSATGIPYIDSDSVSVISNVYNQVCISDTYKQIATAETGVSGSFKQYGKTFTVYDERFVDLATASSLLSSVHFVAPIGSPFTVQLTPQQVNTLLGANNIWHDANGEISVIFRADPTLFVNTKIMQAVSSALNT